MIRKVTLYQSNNHYDDILTVGSNVIQLESKLFSVVKEGSFYFHILKDIRAELQNEAVFILLNGCRKDVYPSGMSLSGYMAYILTMGKPTSLKNLVNIFDDFTELDKISTVEEQSNYHSQWIESLSV